MNAALGRTEARRRWMGIVLSVCMAFVIRPDDSVGAGGAYVAYPDSLRQEDRLHLGLRNVPPSQRARALVARGTVLAADYCVDVARASVHGVTRYTVAIDSVWAGNDHQPGQTIEVHSDGALCLDPEDGSPTIATWPDSGSLSLIVGDEILFSAMPHPSWFSAESRRTDPRAKMELFLREVLIAAAAEDDPARALWAPVRADPSRAARRAASGDRSLAEAIGAVREVESEHSASTAAIRSRILRLKSARTSEQ